MALDLSFAPDTIVVVVGSGLFATTLIEGEVYTIISTTLAWIQVGSAPVAVVGAPSLVIPPNYPITIRVAKPGLKVAIIRDTADGKATLHRGDTE